MLFPHPIGYLFTPLIIVFAVQKFDFSFVCFSFWYEIRVFIKTSVYPVCFLLGICGFRSYVFKSLIHFELIFVCGVR